MIQIAIFSASGHDVDEAASQAVKSFNQVMRQAQPIEILSVVQQSGYKPSGTAWSMITLLYRGLVPLQ